jgi:phage gp29-like protein
MGLALARLEWWEDNPIATTPEAARTMPKVARIRNGRNVPALKAWNPRCLRYDFHEQVWKVRLENGEEETIKNGLNGWILWLSTESRPWLNGLWRGLAPMFLLIGFAFQDWRDQSEKFAHGVAVFTGPAAHDDDFRAKLVDDWRKAGARGAVYLPEETELHVFEMKADNWKTFEAQIKLAQTSISITVRGANLPTEATEGVGTGANAQSEVMQDIKSGDARAWETFVHENITRPWAWANFLSADVAPWIEVQVQPANDEAKFAKAQKDGAEAYEVWLRTGAPVDVGPFMQKLGTPIDEKRLDAMRKKQDKELSLVEQEAA